jgi:hypothetical protein
VIPQPRFELLSVTGDWSGFDAYCGRLIGVSLSCTILKKKKEKSIPYKDPEKNAAAKRLWQEKNRPNKNNPLKYGIPYKGNEKEYRRLEAAAKRREKPVQYLVAQARYRAKERGIEFTIEWDDLDVPTHCPVFGLELRFSEGRRTDNSYSLDRLDNTVGYIPGNVKVISWKANQYKGDLTVAEVESLLKYMKGNEI